jgi:hypothetical protein
MKLSITTILALTAGTMHHDADAANCTNAGGSYSTSKACETLTLTDACDSDINGNGFCVVTANSCGCTLTASNGVIYFLPSAGDDCEDPCATTTESTSTTSTSETTGSSETTSSSETTGSTETTGYTETDGTTESTGTTETTGATETATETKTSACVSPFASAAVTLAAVGTMIFN